MKKNNICLNSLGLYEFDKKVVLQILNERFKERVAIFGKVLAVFSAISTVISVSMTVGVGITNDSSTLLPSFGIWCIVSFLGVLLSFVLLDIYLDE